MLMLLGFSLIATFMVAIMTGRLSALIALIVLPLLFGVFAGYGADLGMMAVSGVVQLAPTASLLLFAVLYFGIMIDAGLFDPLVTRVIRFAGGDPLRVAIGTAVVALTVSLDGDGATTALVTITAFLPVYRKLKMNPLIIAVLLGSANSVINLAPWGGPVGRVAAALHVDPADVFIPLLPTIVAGMASTLLFAWLMGRAERKRLGVVAIDTDMAFEALKKDENVARPRLVYVNLLLTLGLLAAAIARAAPLPLVFMVGLALALLINYPDLREQRVRLASHAANAMPIVLLILAAGVFTGILSGTGMLDAMARGALAAVPAGAGSHMALVMAFLSAPLSFILSTDAYYFGVVPIVARTAATYSVPVVEIARASLLGAPIHALSPLVAAVYLVAGLLDCEVGTLQRFALKWACLLTLVLVVTAIVTGAII